MPFSISFFPLPPFFFSVYFPTSLFCISAVSAIFFHYLVPGLPQVLRLSAGNRLQNCSSSCVQIFGGGRFDCSLRLGQRGINEITKSQTARGESRRQILRTVGERSQKHELFTAAESMRTKFRQAGWRTTGTSGHPQSSHFRRREFKAAPPLRLSLPFPRETLRRKTRPKQDSRDTLAPIGPHLQKFELSRNFRGRGTAQHSLCATLCLS